MQVRDSTSLFLLIDNRLDVIRMDPKTPKSTWVLGGMAFGLALLLIGLVLKPYLVSADASRVAMPPTGTHVTTKPVSPHTTTSQPSQPSPSPVDTPTSTPQQKFVPMYDTRCGVPSGVTALSYDDSYYNGKYGKALDLADYAKSLDVGLYYFQLKQQADAYEAQTGENLYDGLRGKGMYTGNHTYDHKILTDVKLAKAEWEITHGARSGWLRPPGGASNQEILRLAYAHEQDVCTWGFDSRDWDEKPLGRFQTGGEICANVVANAPKGSVILLHLNHNAANNKTLKCIVDGLRAKGHNLCRPYTDTHPGESTPVRLYKLPC